MDVNTIAMDNDSGYVSQPHQQESHLDLPVNVVSMKYPAKSFCISEDALLENPLMLDHRSESFDSIISKSQSSDQMQLSCFEDTDVSDSSLIIPLCKPIMFHVNKDNMTSTDERNTFIGVAKASPSTKNILGNVTNIMEATSVTSGSFIKPPSFKKNCSVDKENVCPASTPFKQINQINSNFSPDLFSEEDSCYPSIKSVSPVKMMVENYGHKHDLKLLKRVQNALSGVCPPPSLTLIHMTASEILEKIDNNSNLFWSSEPEVSVKDDLRSRSLLLSSVSVDLSSSWPRILRDRHHGLHYNRSKVSEELEYLCSKYAERYVGAETESTCTVFESNLSPSKRKIVKPRWTAKSLGRRLSHLARRRITFSSANLQASSSSSLVGFRARQILVDTKKLGLLGKKKSPPRKGLRKSPRKTPSKSPFRIKKKTPSSSAKKKLALKFRQISGEIESIVPTTSLDNQRFKRALFGSPDSDKTLASDFGAEKKSTKRALFQSPHRKSPLKGISERKRKRSDSDENSLLKFSQSMSFDLRPSPAESRALGLMNRTLNDSSVSLLNTSRTEELSDVHKKKLQWAVYESLRLQNVTPTHAQYKIFASVLARVTRRFLPSSSGPRLEGRTSERMFRIARYHSYAVVKGKTVDEIVNEYIKNKAKNQKPRGYIGIEEFNNLKNNGSNQSKENVIQNRNSTITSTDNKRENACTTTKKSFVESRIEKIKKRISFEENQC